jgi:hypothetical protein
MTRLCVVTPSPLLPTIRHKSGERPAGHPEAKSEPPAETLPRARRARWNVGHAGPGTPPPRWWGANVLGSRTPPPSLTFQNSGVPLSNLIQSA